jgi:hypothetical protein
MPAACYKWPTRLYPLAGGICRCSRPGSWSEMVCRHPISIDDRLPRNDVVIGTHLMLSGTLWCHPRALGHSRFIRHSGSHVCVRFQ